VRSNGMDWLRPHILTSSFVACANVKCFFAKMTSL
jgi:hypothetical protein